MSKTIGYARTSTFDQEAGLAAQVKELEAQGCDRIFSEQVSSVDREKRTKLAEALDYLREGDVLVVTKLDRLARSTRHLLEIVDTVEGKGASLRILAMNLDTSNATGRMMLTVIGSIAQFEREMMLERQREGIAKAKAEGKYRGRKPTAQAKADDIRTLAGEGMGPTEIAERLGIGRTSVWRVMKAQGIEGPSKVQ